MWHQKRYVQETSADCLWSWCAMRYGALWWYLTSFLATAALRYAFFPLKKQWQSDGLQEGGRSVGSVPSVHKPSKIRDTHSVPVFGAPPKTKKIPFIQPQASRGEWVLTWHESWVDISTASLHVRSFQSMHKPQLMHRCQEPNPGSKWDASCVFNIQRSRTPTDATGTKKDKETKAVRQKQRERFRLNELLISVEGRL